MTRQDYIKDQIDRRWPEQFKNHRAKFHTWDNTFASFIEWKDPVSWNYGIRYIVQSQWLFAYGDLFEATYQWSEAVKFEWLATLDLDYFLGKCRASPTGRQFQVWDRDVGKAGLVEFKDEIRRSVDHFENDDVFSGDELIIDGSSQEHVRLLALGVYARTGDSELYSAICECGLVPGSMAIGHFVGIKMAVQQLKDRELL